MKIVNLKILLAVLALGGSVSGLYNLRLLSQSFPMAVAESAPPSTGGAQSQAHPNPPDLIPEAKKLHTDPIIAAAGDIACQPLASTGAENTDSTCQMQATSDLLLDQDLTAVLPLGDLQYERGEGSGFQQSYDPTWGRVKAISHPVAGNHEYYSKNAADYYQYFGKVAGDPAKGYYSYDIGNWHIIALNSNCQAVGGCEAGSPQEQWLQQDLDHHLQACTLAYWHHPRFSSGIHGNSQDLDAFWQALYKAKAEIVLNGHDHHYERFKPQTPTTKLDIKNGIREFVVGTGGRNLRPVLQVQANSAVQNSDSYGVLKLTLRPHGYAWQFVSIAGQSFSDAGEDICH